MLDNAVSFQPILFEKKKRRKTRGMQGPVELNMSSPILQKGTHVLTSTKGNFLPTTSLLQKEHLCLCIVS
jgi:hypothetical protein